MSQPVPRPETPRLEALPAAATRRLVSRTMDEMAEAIGATLGPHGATVALLGGAAPRVTKDGATVARAFQYADARQAVSELVNEALAAVDRAAGDGTTSTAVVANALYQRAARALDEGKITLPALRAGLQAAAAAAEAELARLAAAPGEAQLAAIARTAAGDDALGELVHRAARAADFVRVVERPEADWDGVEETRGVQYDQGYVTSYFATDGATAALERPIVLLCDGVVERAEQVRGALEAAAGRCWSWARTCAATRSRRCC